MEWFLVGISIFIGCLIGSICGYKMGVDSCFEHIKDCIFVE